MNLNLDTSRLNKMRKLGNTIGTVDLSDIIVGIKGEIYALLDDLKTNQNL